MEIRTKSDGLRGFGNGRLTGELGSSLEAWITTSSKILVSVAVRR